MLATPTVTATTPPPAFHWELPPIALPAAMLAPTATEATHAPAPSATTIARRPATQAGRTVRIRTTAARPISAPRRTAEAAGRFARIRTAANRVRPVPA